MYFFLVIALAIVINPSFAFSIDLFCSFEGVTVLLCSSFFKTVLTSYIGTFCQAYLVSVYAVALPYNLETLDLFHGLILGEHNFVM